MSVKISIVGVQVKHVKGALQFLSRIGDGKVLLSWVRVEEPLKRGT